MTGEGRYRNLRTGQQPVEIAPERKRVSIVFDHRHKKEAEKKRDSQAIGIVFHRAKSRVVFNVSEGRKTVVTIHVQKCDERPIKA